MKRILLFIWATLFSALVHAQIGEPDMNVAKAWWPEQYNVWTPLSWPDHYIKYTVLYNGTVVLAPATGARWRPNSKQWEGEDFQLTFCASQDGHPYALPQNPGYTILREWDGGLGLQHWDYTHDAPVLETEFRSKDGVVIGAKMFAHVSGGSAIETALESEYLWIRLKVNHVDGYYHPDEYKMSVMLTNLFLGHIDFGKLSPDIGLVPELAVSSHVLSMEDALLPGGQSVHRIVREDGKVRLDVLQGTSSDVSFSEAIPKRYVLNITFPAKEGAWADLVLPMLPDETQRIGKESSMTCEKALEESDSFWKSILPASLATFDVPEKEFAEAVRSNLSFASVIAERDYKTLDYSLLTGIWTYDALWATPGAMVSAMFLDHIGAYPQVDKYTGVFARVQGTCVPKGPSYGLHPGFFCVPRHIESVDWLSDHGAIMYQVATHALLSADQDYIARWTEPLLKACDFIRDYSLAEHPGVAGLLPAAWASDEEVPLQAVWNLAWNYKGLYETARLLTKTGHPRASEISAFAAKFKETFQLSYRKVVEAGPRWTDASGRVRFRPPTELVPAQTGSQFQTEGHPAGYTFMTDAFYLDTGPLCLVWSGLLDADDPIMVDMLDFFREGPNWDLRKPFPWSLDRAVLVHEISSCEPCYSFNVFHSWRKGERQQFLEGMYSILTASVSQNTYISSEHRHGIQGIQCSFALGFYLARLAVIDDQIASGDLHLLRFCPLAWLKTDEKARFLRMPTEFGPVDLTAGLSSDGKTLEVTFKGDWREKPGEVVLHVPPVPGLKKVSVNGKRYSAGRGEIRLKF